MDLKNMLEQIEGKKINKELEENTYENYEQKLDEVQRDLKEIDALKIRADDKLKEY